MLEEEKHILYVIGQSNQIITEGSLVSLVFSGQEDAGTRVTHGGRIMDFRCIVRHGEYLPKKCEKLLKFETIFGIFTHVSWATGVPRAIL